MEEGPALGDGAFAANLLGFGRMLRRAGLPLGPGEMLAGAEALTRIDLGDRRQTEAALRATLVHRREHFEIFDQAFALFWRDSSAPTETREAEPGDSAPPASRRVS